MAEYSNILIVKPGAIGDLLQLTPVIRALQEKFPAARITLLVGNRASCELFRHNPCVHEVIVFDKRGEHRSLAAFARLWQRLRASRFDLVVNFQRSNLKAWLLISAAFPCRVLIYHKARNRSVHAVVNHLETLAPLGIGTSHGDLEFIPGEEAERFAKELFKSSGLAGKTVVALNPGTSHPDKCWSTDHFAVLADLLTERLRVGVVIVGGSGDVQLAEDIISRAKSSPLVLTGKTDLLQLGAVLKQCALLVSGDTGPLHMATAVGTPVVGLFGSVDPARTGPIGAGHRVIQATNVSCVPCRERECKSSIYLECMTEISPEEVFQAVCDMLGADSSTGTH